MGVGEFYRSRGGRRAAVAVSAGVALALAACGTGSASPAPHAKGRTSSKVTSSLAKALAGKDFKVAVDLSYYGNDWQTEALNLIKAEAKTPPYKGHVTLRVDIAGASVPNQIQAINNEVAAGEKAIIMYPISPTGLNAAIAKACRSGVVVYAYNAYVTAPCAHNVTTSDFEFGTLQARGLAQFLHGKGNVAEMTGVAGTSADIERRAGWASVLKHYPNIHVVATANGMWDAATTQQAFSSLYASHPNVDGVLAETSCQAVENALIAQGHRLLPCAGESENQWRIMMLSPSKGGKGVKGVSVGGPAYTGELAFINAISILTGHKVAKDMEVPLPYVTSATLHPGTNVAKGANVFPPSVGLKVPAGFFDDLWSPLVNEGVKAALTGRPDVISPIKPCGAVRGCITGNSVKLFLTFGAGTVAE
jgi:ribose transport system substrate-binding protein